MAESDVKFATDRRIHIGLAVSSVDESTRFYRTLFETEPSKTRAGYARFELLDPPLNLSLIEAGDAQGPADGTSHYGIQLKSSAAVDGMKQRLEKAGLATRVEATVHCCHAVQDKVWVVDPDGHRWECFVVLDDAPSDRSPANECCPATSDELCCTLGDEPCCAESR